MKAVELLQDLRRKGVRLRTDGLILYVAAPRGMDIQALSTTLRNHKCALIRLLEHERRRLEQAASSGLVIEFSRKPGYVSVHDPTTGVWHELPVSGSPPWLLETTRACCRRGRRTNR